MANVRSGAENVQNDLKPLFITESKEVIKLSWQEDSGTVLKRFPLARAWTRGMSASIITADGNPSSRFGSMRGK